MVSMRNFMPLLIGVASVSAVQAFVGGFAVPHHSVRSSTSAARVSMDMERGQVTRRAIITTLIGLPLLPLGEAQAAGLNFLPPALRDAANSAQRKKGIEPEPEPVVEEVKPEPLPKKRAPKAEKPKEEPNPEPKAAAPKPVPEPKLKKEIEVPENLKKTPKVEPKLKKEIEVPEELKKPEKVEKVKREKKAPKKEAPVIQPESSEPEPVLKKQRVAGATGKESFNTKETLSLEEKLKKRAAKTVDSSASNLNIVERESTLAPLPGSGKKKD